MAAFQGIGEPDFSLTHAYGISAQGALVTGTYGESKTGFIWSTSTGMIGIPSSDECYAVSNIGPVVVGQSSTRRAFYWTESTGVVELGAIYEPSSSSSIAYDVSSDGAIVVGYDTSGGSPEAFRWTQENGMVGLGDLAGGVDFSVAYGVSSNRLVITGYSKSDIGNEAFRWTEATGMVGLGVVEGRSSSIAYGISADGSTIVGQSGYEAFRWTEETGMIGLGILGGILDQTMAVDVSGDGSIVIGNSMYEGAFIWDELHGTRELDNALVDDYGLDLAGWNLGNVEAISDNGLTITGWGVNPQGNVEAWIVTVPEPATIVFLGVSCLLLRRPRRR